MQSNSRPLVQLDIDAQNPLTEIFLIDSNFKRINQGLGELKVDVSPGLYKVRFRSGSEQKDQFVEVGEHQSSVAIKSESIENRPNVLKASEEMLAQIEAQSLQFHKRCGNGSSLFILYQDKKNRAEAELWDGLTVYDMDGELVASQPEGYYSAEFNFSALNIELDPGTYSLRVESGVLGIFQMFVVTSRKWQTQVFLDAGKFNTGEDKARRPSLKKTMVMMSNIHMGFDRSCKDLELTELARQGLISGRNIISHSVMEQLLSGKFGNPMLGIYSAHLLLRSSRPNYELFDTVIHNLRNMLDKHPDVEALALRLRNKDESMSRSNNLKQSRFSSPPMLSSSWDLIVKHSFRMSSRVIEKYSYLDNMVDGLVATPTWLLHRSMVSSSKPADARSILEKKSIELLELFKIQDINPDTLSAANYLFSKAVNIYNKSGIKSGLNYADVERIIDKLLDSDELARVRSGLEQLQRDPETTPMERNIITSVLNIGEMKEMFLSNNMIENIEPVTARKFIRQIKAPKSAISRSVINIANKLARMN